MTPTLEQHVFRITGTVERLPTRWQYGSIIATTGERLYFDQGEMLRRDPTWRPRFGEPVTFERILSTRGLKARKLRPLRFA
jgi:hypothetical protein